ncbi:MAG TPA: hypothetical protein VMG99_01945 [Thermoplasmata archaeon]|nr:hypothetical protein [Thermoplasmata archaeon]
MTDPAGATGTDARRFASPAPADPHGDLPLVFEGDGPSATPPASPTGRELALLDPTAVERATVGRRPTGTGRTRRR